MQPNPVIDYYFAPISGYAYLGHVRFKEIAQKADAQVNFHPLDMPAVFEANGIIPPAAQSENRQSYRMEDMTRWADLFGLPINLKPAHWPTNPKPAARVILAAGKLGLDQWSITGAILAGVWEKEANIADPNDLAKLLEPVCQDIQALFDAADGCEAGLVEVTQNAIATSVFGSPTYITKGQKFWGQDRLDFLERALGI